MPPLTVFSAALLLLIVMDPFGNIPFFLAALRQVDPARHRRIIVRELLVALAALLIFLFAGQHLLALLGISESALTTAGGVVLFLIAVKMIFPPSGGAAVEEVSGEPFIVPLAIPYVAGPSSMASVLLIMNREPARWPEWMAAVLLAWLVTSVILFASGGLSRYLGRKGLIAIERLMGMLLVAIAVQTILSGVAQFLEAN